MWDAMSSDTLVSVAHRSIPGPGIAALVVITYVFGVPHDEQVGGRRPKTTAVADACDKGGAHDFFSGQVLVDSMSGESAAGLSRVVMIEYPRPGLWAVGLTGFTTVGRDRRLALVYLPTACVRS